jgi:drug/metabolite transporter (DMT)-like permease
MESSILNNTMLFQIALLAWSFWAKRLTWVQGLGMALAMLGTFVVQARKSSSTE